jgi:zinc protease
MDSPRAKAPRIRRDIHPILPPVEHIQLDNGMPLYLVQGGTEPVMKLEILFKAGRPFEHKKQVSRLMCQMLLEGTTARSGKQLSEHFDYFGSNISPYLSMDHTGLTLFCLEKHATAVVPVLLEILTQPSFDDSEFARLQQNALEKLQLDLSKNDFIAYRELTQVLYGPEHYYGYNSSADIIRAADRSDLVVHYNKTYGAQNGYAFLSGRLKPETVAMVCQYLNQLSSGAICKPISPPDFVPLKGSHRFASPNTHQVAVRLGRKLFPHNHPDFDDMYILNTILGGYFGSRLMSQIREESGYTYNIYSSMENLLFDGTLLIAMECDKAFEEESVSMIEKELVLLQEKAIRPAELNMVRSYLLGYMLTAIDGPFNVMEIVRNMVVEGSNMRLFDEFINRINQIQSAELQELARKYLNPDDFVRVYVG